MNYGGMITVDAMVLGNSSKRGQSGATGFFGEGVKVEINRLTASGMGVTYITPAVGSTTHHATWEFRCCVMVVVVFDLSTNSLISILTFTNGLTTSYHSSPVERERTSDHWVPSVLPDVDFRHPPSFLI